MILVIFSGSVLRQISSTHWAATVAFGARTAMGRCSCRDPRPSPRTTLSLCPAISSRQAMHDNVFPSPMLSARIAPKYLGARSLFLIFTSSLCGGISSSVSGSVTFNDGRLPRNLDRIQTILSLKSSACITEAEV